MSSESDNLARMVRRYVVEMTNAGGSSHVASALGIADILAVLYASIMTFRPAEPDWPHRDRFVLSKGHAGAALYSVLARSGFFDPSELRTHYQNGSRLSGHVSHLLPGVEVSTGSLGHGLPLAAGFAYSLKLKRICSRVFCLVSEGDLDEGSTWEAVLFAAHHELKNLTLILDNNGLQSLTTTQDTLNLDPLPDKFQAFGWDVVTTDGHNHPDLLQSMAENNSSSHPTAVIAKTTKGKGVSFMENSVLWHYRTPAGEEFSSAMTELRFK